MEVPANAAAGTFPRLLGDIGGTNARFAWQAQRGGALQAIATYRSDEYPSLEAALRRYLDEHAHATPPGCAVGIANPITGDEVRMTNHHWSFSITALQRELGFERFVVINDFTALALSLPDLADDDLRPIGRGVADPLAARAVIGPGTGLGVSGLLPQPDGGYLPINGEGGHVTLSAGSSFEAQIIACLAGRLGHVSAERALSGPGLVMLSAAVATVEGRTPQALQPAEVLAGADSDRDCSVAVDLFCAFLGGAAGNLALTLGARGGVYIGGGIAPRLIDRLRHSAFRLRFESKGRMKSYLEPIPTWVIQSGVSPALLGASRALD